MAIKLYQELAGIVVAAHNCEKMGNMEWELKHKEHARQLVRDRLPHGAGFDCGTTLDVEDSTEDRLVFQTSFHHMNDGGYYDGWTEHEVIVTPSLHFGFHLRVTGKNRNDIKNYIAECFGEALNEDLVEKIEVPEKLGA